MGRGWIFIAVILFWGCSHSSSLYIYESSNLKIRQLGSHTYQHISYLAYKGKPVGCNGVFAIFDKDVIIIDSPTNDKATGELLDFIDKEFSPVKKMAIPNHFHVDCTGGMNVMEARDVDLYAFQKTLELMEDQGLAEKINAFDPSFEIKLGDGEGRVITKYFGPAHTMDNTVSYILPDSILFGGCMMKSLNAGKGNIADADTLQWSNTVSRIKEDSFGKAKLVVPGHGAVGGTELLDYTIQMFEN